MVKRVSRDDVARLAGTSAAVVSYVINGGPRNVSPERRQRVLAAIKELGYEPSPIARSLAGSGTGTTGMIVPNLDSSFFSELATAVEEAALQTGRLVFIGNSAEDRRREAAYVSSFVRHRVDGVVVIGVSKQLSLQPALDEGIPVVVVDRPNPHALIRSVSIDHAEAAETATAHLIGHGYDGIACLTGMESTFVSDDRLEGFRRAMGRAGLEPVATLRSPYSYAGGATAWERLKELPNLPRAVFCASDDQARGLIAAALADGISVPERLATVSIDGTKQASVLKPSLTTVRQPSDVIAQATLRRLFEDAQAELHWGVPTELIIGRSCGCTPD
ncbi:transcriptional regulator, LacI family [Mycetocola miduiensis]|uniref:Transcriptional regulator, LacI family n=1 Tax=Mycetocola miduiensis TaxID=995034 RepID=A0A1I4Y9S8_9MICO|nr:transcriptional regulator, LacI family [Mycetocola miduiensis]